MVDDPLIRPARAGDLEAIGAIRHTDPEPEMTGLTGSRDRARELGLAITRMEGVDAPDRPHVVRVIDEEVVGFLAYSTGSSPADEVTLPFIWAAARICHVHTLPLLARLRIKNRVAVDTPPDSFSIVELHVHPDRRGEGIGDSLLRWAVAESARLDIATMALSTTIGNPAQRLYERHGFEVVERRTDAAYERMTGRAGRVLMTRAT